MKSNQSKSESNWAFQRLFGVLFFDLSFSVAPTGLSQLQTWQNKSLPAKIRVGIHRANFADFLLNLAGNWVIFSLFDCL
jgi:hypothetical protein